MAAMNVNNFINTVTSRRGTLAVIASLGLMGAVTTLNKQPLLAPVAVPTTGIVPAVAKIKVPVGPVARTPRTLFRPTAYSSWQHSRPADPNTNWIFHNPVYNFYADRSLKSGEMMGEIARTDAGWGLLGLGLLAGIGALVTGVRKREELKVIVREAVGKLRDGVQKILGQNQPPAPMLKTKDDPRHSGDPGQPDPWAVGGEVATLEIPATGSPDKRPATTPAEHRKALRRAARAGTGATTASSAMASVPVGTVAGVSPDVVADMADTMPVASGESSVDDWDVDTGNVEIDLSDETIGESPDTLEPAEDDGTTGTDGDSWDVGESDADGEFSTLKLEANPEIAAAAGVTDEDAVATHSVPAPVAPVVTGGDDDEETVKIRIDEVSGAGVGADGDREGSDHEGAGKDQ